MRVMRKANMDDKISNTVNLYALKESVMTALRKVVNDYIFKNISLLNERAVEFMCFTSTNRN